MKLHFRLGVKIYLRIGFLSAVWDKLWKHDIWNIKFSTPLTYLEVLFVQMLGMIQWLIFYVAIRIGISLDWKCSCEENVSQQDADSD